MAPLKYAALIFASLHAPIAVADSAAQWPAWRGPLATGVSPDADPPLEWSETKNIRWKVAIPGRGHGSPIVWGDRIFVQTAVPVGEAVGQIHVDVPGAHDNAPVTHRQALVVMALSCEAGHINWQRTVHEALPHEGGHVTASQASASPVTDGTRVYAFFGSNGLYCLTVEGESVWHRDFGRMQTKHGHGEGSSPTLYGETLVVNWDHEGDSFIAALNKRTGQFRWRKPRDEPTSWATPIIVEREDHTQVIVSGTHRIRAYDLADGDVIWECGGLSANVVASPVAGEGYVFAGSSYTTRRMLAIRLKDAAGDVTGTPQVAWSTPRGAPYVPSPLLYGNAIYYLSHYQPVITRLHAYSGALRPGAFRLPGLASIYASPVAAAGRVYVTDLEGTTLVMRNENPPVVLALNHLETSVSASVALVGKAIFLRGEKVLYCISEQQ